MQPHLSLPTVGLGIPGREMGTSLSPSQDITSIHSNETLPTGPSSDTMVRAVWATGPWLHGPMGSQGCG